MAQSFPRYRIPSRIPTTAVVSGLSDQWTVAPERAATVERTYLDTADWRVFAAGWTLEVDDQAGNKTLSWRDLATGASKARISIGYHPRFVADLPAADAWDALRAAVDVRRLIGQAQVRTTRRPVRIINDQGKTTARVVLEHHQLANGNGRGHRLARDAAIVPVRGYDRVAARVAALLGGTLGLALAGDHLLIDAMATLGQPAPGLRKGPAAPLQPAMTAGEAMGAVLARLREQLLENEDGVRRQLDTEFLHDYRVALRRTRSIIRQVTGVLVEEEGRSLAAQLAWLAALTGPPRDLDVHLLELPATESDTLTPLIDHLTNQRHQAQTLLLKALDSRRYHKLLDAWAERSAAATSTAAAARPRVGLPVRDVTDACIARAYRRVLRRGRAIEASTPAEALHDLRKRCKELRYLLECFHHLYPDEQRAAVVRELKALQDNLGEFQDCQVQAAALRSMAEELVEARAAPAATLMTMGRLAEGLEHREARARAEFGSRFRRFAAPPNRERFDLLLAGSRGTPGPA